MATVTPLWTWILLPGAEENAHFTASPPSSLVVGFALSFGLRARHTRSIINETTPVIWPLPELAHHQLRLIMAGGHKLGNTRLLFSGIGPLSLGVASLSLSAYINIQNTIMWPLKVEEERPGRPATLVVPASYCLQHMWRDASGSLVMRFTSLCSPPRETECAELQQSTTMLTPPPLDPPETASLDTLQPDFTVFKHAGHWLN